MRIILFIHELVTINRKKNSKHGEGKLGGGGGVDQARALRFSHHYFRVCPNSYKRLYFEQMTR